MIVSKAHFIRRTMNQATSKLAMSMTPSTITHNLRNFTTLTGIVAGAGIYFAAHKEHYYIHVPLAFLAPGMYVGYHTYKHRETVIPYVLDLVSKIKKL
jgi:hypothetical protein